MIIKKKKKGKKAILKKKNSFSHTTYLSKVFIVSLLYRYAYVLTVLL